MKKMLPLLSGLLMLFGCSEKDSEEDPSEVENLVINEDNDWELQLFQDQKLADFIMPRPQEILILEEPETESKASLKMK